MKRALRFHRFRWVGIVIAVFGIGFAVLSQSSIVRAGTNVSGTVKGPNNATLSEAVQVCLQGQNGTCFNTDNTGVFSQSVNPGTYKAQASPLSQSSSYASSVQVDVTVVDGQTTTINLSLTNVQMKGTILKPDGSAAAFASINVHNADFSVTNFGQAGNDGSYKVGGLANGTYMVEINPPYGSTGLSAPAPSTVTLSDSVLSQDFSLTAAAKTITGTVIRSDGTTVTDANMNAFKVSGQGFANGHVDSTGKYTLTVTGGTWQVQPQADSSSANWIFTGSGQTISFNDDASTETKSADFTVTKATVTIAGTVTKADGTPLTTGNLNFRTQDGRGSSANIAANGTYSVGMSAGTYQVFLWTQTNDVSLDPTTVNVKDGDVVTLNLSVKQKLAKIQGTVSLASGAAAAGVQINAFQMTGPGGGPGAFGQTTTASDGTYTIAVTAGDWGVNIGMGPNSSFVPVAQKQFTVNVPTETSIVTASNYPDLNFVVVRADATITGRVLTKEGTAVTNFSGCVYARPVGAFNESCGPVQGGVFTVKVSSTTATTYELGVHTPPNSQYSGGAPVTVTITPDGTKSADVTLAANNSSIVVGLQDSTGFPVTTLKCRGMVFADSPNGHYQGEFNSSGSASISLVAGSYRLGVNFDKSCGFLNQPPSNDAILVLDGQSVSTKVPVAIGDATISIKLVDANGVGVRGYAMVDNHSEIQNSRELQGPPGGQGGQPGKPGEGGGDLGFNRKGPCGATDVQGILKCCGDPKNQKVCAAFPVPNGPNGCNNAATCAAQCKKAPNACQDQGKQGDQGQQAGKDFTGPGGCKSEDECKTFCSKPENATTCQQFKPPESAKTVRIASRSVKAAASVLVTPGKGTKNENGPAGFDNAIRSGGELDSSGNGAITVLSGHKYSVCAGLPPESNGMPPKCVDVDLTTTKTANVVLQLRNADGTVTGKVTLNGAAVGLGFVHAWAEDGGFSGGQVSSNGTYKVSVTKGTVWHIGSDMLNGTDFYHSDEALISVVPGTKSYSQNLTLQKGQFTVPQPVTTSFSCSSSTNVTLSNGTKIALPGGAVSTSSDGTCSITVTPTTDLHAMKSAQPFQSGYTIEARDENNAPVTKLLSSATITFSYDKEYAEAQGQDASALGAGFYDTTAGSWTSLSSCTSDTDNETISCPTDHFSSYSLLNTSGSSSSGNLKSVTLGTKAGKTTFTVNKKTVTPFTCKGTVTVKTASLAGKQYIVAGADCDTTVKIYSTAPKLAKSIKLFKVQSVGLADVNGDGNKDIAIGSSTGTPTLVVLDVKKGYKKTALPVTGTGKVILTPLEAKAKGKANIVALVDKTFEVFTYSKGKYSVDKGFNASTLKESSGTISFTPVKPSVKSVSPSSVSYNATSKTVKITLTGENFTSTTSGVVCTNVTATVKYKSSTKVELSFNANQLTKGKKCTVTLTNGDGGTATSKKLLTVK